MQKFIILALFFSLLVAIFAIQNAVVVTVSFLFWESEISLVFVILGSVAVGALIVTILGLFRQYKLGRENKRLQLKLQEVEAERDELRELSVSMEQDEEHTTEG